MNRYSPIWSQIVDSSLWYEPDYVVKVFITLLAKKDMDDVVRGSAFNISKWANKTEKETLEALKILSSPDKRRIEPQEHDGRRIRKVEEGWLVLNGSKYRKMMALATRREYQRLKQQEYREKAKGVTVLPGEAGYVKAVEDGASEEQLDGIVTKNLPRKSR